MLTLFTNTVIDILVIEEERKYVIAINIKRTLISEVRCRPLKTFFKVFKNKNFAF